MQESMGRYLSKNALKRALLDHDWSLRELSSRTGISYDRLVKISGGYRPARPDELHQLAAVLIVNESSLTTTE